LADRTIGLTDGRTADRNLKKNDNFLANGSKNVKCISRTTSVVSVVVLVVANIGVVRQLVASLYEARTSHVHQLRRLKQVRSQVVVWMIAFAQQRLLVFH